MAVQMTNCCKKIFLGHLCHSLSECLVCAGVSEISKVTLGASATKIWRVRIKTEALGTAATKIWLAGLL